MEHNFRKKIGIRSKLGVGALGFTICTQIERKIKKMGFGLGFLLGLGFVNGWRWGCTELEGLGLGLGFGFGFWAKGWGLLGFGVGVWVVVPKGYGLGYRVWVRVRHCWRLGFSTGLGIGYMTKMVHGSLQLPTCQRDKLTLEQTWLG